MLKYLCLSCERVHGNLELVYNELHVTTWRNCKCLLTQDILGMLNWLHSIGSRSQNWLHNLQKKNYVNNLVICLILPGLQQGHATAWSKFKFKCADSLFSKQAWLIVDINISLGLFCTNFTCGIEYKIIQEKKHSSPPSEEAELWETLPQCRFITLTLPSNIVWGMISINFALWCSASYYYAIVQKLLYHNDI